jgi:hypothetical protein
MDYPFCPVGYRAKGREATSEASRKVALKARGTQLAELLAATTAPPKIATNGIINMRRRKDAPY